MLKRIRTRLSSRKGESLAETLISMLVASVGLVLLASMISVSANMVRTSADRIEDYVEEENRIVERSDDDAGVVFGTVTIYEEDGLGRLEAMKLADGVEETIYVDYYVNDEIGSDAVVSYKVGDIE